MTEGSDTMLLQRQLAELQQELNHWSESRPVNGMGNYARKVKLESVQNRIASLRAALSKSSGSVQCGNQNDKPIKPE